MPKAKDLKKAKYATFGKNFRAKVISCGCKGSNEMELARNVQNHMKKKVDERSVVRWLQGDSMPHINQLVCLAKSLNFSIDEVVGLK